MLSWKQCALLFIIKRALWQLMHLGTWCTVTHCPYQWIYIYIYIYYIVTLYAFYINVTKYKLNGKKLSRQKVCPALSRQNVSVCVCVCVCVYCSFLFIKIEVYSWIFQRVFWIFFNLNFGYLIHFENHALMFLISLFLDELLMIYVTLWLLITLYNMPKGLLHILLLYEPLIGQC